LLSQHAFGGVALEPLQQSVVAGAPAGLEFVQIGIEVIMKRRRLHIAAPQEIFDRLGRREGRAKLHSDHG